MNLFCLLLLSMQMPLHSAFQLSIPAKIKTYCPLTTFCKNSHHFADRYRKGYEPCCRVCTCHSDCGRQRNCCFETPDSDHVDNVLNSSCVSPMVNESPNIHWYRRWYHMVDKCPGSSTVCQEDNPWGDLFPVYSHENGFIYYNKNCAKCHGVYNVTTWRIGFLCETSGTNIGSISNSIEQAVSGIDAENGGCMVLFVPPLNTDVLSERCIPEDSLLLGCPSDANVTSDTERHCQNYNISNSQLDLNDDHEQRTGFKCYACTGGHSNNFRDLCTSDQSSSKAPNQQSIIMLFQDVQKITEISQHLQPEVSCFV